VDWFGKQQRQQVSGTAQEDVSAARLFFFQQFHGVHTAMNHDLLHAKLNSAAALELVSPFACFLFLRNSYFAFHFLFVRLCFLLSLFFFSSSHLEEGCKFLGRNGEQFLFGSI
jgi:hypothetical protein